MSFHKQTVRGFILVTTLLLTTLITALILTMLQVGFLQVKMAHNFMKGEDRLSLINATLKQTIQNSMQRTESCLLKVSSNELTKRSYAFWESSATCHSRYQNHAFQYVVEPLQTASCLQYERMTLRYPLQNGLSDVLVQATFLKHDFNETPDSCKQQRVVTSLIQSWRRLR
ncbi:MAG: hypothetical protein KKA99_03425 [Gammaproteobacteria bacterium]|nr:hypothetical protein [Gammaproteobacteria bacterium]MBU1558945.1 hypothetical protein [Gammaproteobacteria bacterium]MBU1927159.1 hypothetical protein [Gammaproteobacteria bacterium]MBU2546229.1 hypothetical protein [Gammaproteobacteria bacterium]